MINYQTRRSWSDLHLDDVKKALGREFLKISNFQDDVKRGIDLYMPQLNFAVRIRQSTYKNFNDFTLRSSGGGDRSEYAKMLSSDSPEYMFYGYAFDKLTVAPGYLIDLTQWKLSIKLGEVKPQFRRNKDGSHFVAFPFHASYSRQVS